MKLYQNFIPAVYYIHMSGHLKVGKTGEDIATKYLQYKGFTIQERNYLRRWGELDIVALKDNAVHFVEVKSMRVDRVGKEYRPEENIHRWKQVRLARAIQTYLLERNLRNKEWAFHVIVVKINPALRKATVEVLWNVILEV